MTASGASAGPSTWIRSSSGATAASLRAKLSAGRDGEAAEPAKRPIAGAFALLDFAGVKRLAIVRGQRLHHGMLGLVRLQIADAAALLAAGAADHLIEQLERPLGGARIAIVQAEIGVDHN